ncbi:MAG TPA: alpha/beta hydrolase [Pyrinomonadaceae bacterium]|nr:alpha/beta hydrolase [Pyrinomonadaceae bacterium]
MHPYNQRLLYPILKIVLLLAFIVIGPTGVTAQVWTVLAGDAKGDARDPSLADAAQLSYRYDKQQDFLWFRVSLYGTPNEHVFGVNIVFDTGGDEAAKMNWWGANKTLRFDKLVTAWVTSSDNGYQGTIGISDAAGANAKQFNNLRQNNLQIRVEGDSILIGVKRTDITDQLKMKLFAAVGSNQRWNDDVPSAGSATIDLSAERPKRGLLEIDLSRNNLQLPADYKTLREDQPPLITEKGRGGRTLILVPGMYSGAESFDGFISRNQSQYKFYLVTPPGINGTPARSIPTDGSSFSELNWTRRLQRDILDLIRREKMNKPVIVADSNPGSVAAIELAVDHPDKIGGVVLVGTNLVQFFPSPKDPTRKSPITFQERITSVDEGWGGQMTLSLHLSNR